VTNENDKQTPHRIVVGDIILEPEGTPFRLEQKTVPIGFLDNLHYPEQSLVRVLAQEEEGTYYIVSSLSVRLALIEKTPNC